MVYDRAIAIELSRSVAALLARCVRPYHRKTVVSHVLAAKISKLELEVVGMRALVFAHFDPHDIVDDYVVFALKCYRSQFDTIIFSTVCRLSGKEIEKAGRYADLIICRPNIGYDFMSWKFGFDALKPEECTTVTFANDSCYGPLGDVELLIRASSASSDALWGAAINHQFSRHVQSFYMTFGGPLLHAGFASQFWNRVGVKETKEDIIFSYEIGLSQSVLQAGLTIGGLVEFDNPSDDVIERVIQDNSNVGEIRADVRGCIENERFPNPMQLYWGEALRKKLPFVKVELLRDNPLQANLRNVMDVIETCPHYDVGLIYNHLRRVRPNARLFEQ